MPSTKLFLSLLSFSFLPFNACAQQEPAPNNVSEEAQEAQPKEEANIHKYGGWYCPDNLSGFPPVNAVALAEVPVVVDRMPTQEEASNGTSLMYFDPEVYPQAKPFDLDLPRMAMYNSGGSRGEEVVVVIQAVIVDQDTVVGFRYLNGGNGTSWYREVELMEQAEVNALGATPFVFLEQKIDASKEEVWDAFTKTDYAKELGTRFLEQAYFDAPWNSEESRRLHYDVPGHIADGYISLHFGNIYMQVHNHFDARPFVEKLLIGDNEDGSANLQIVFGPFGAEFEAKRMEWEKWMGEIKAACEAKQE